MKVNWFSWNQDVSHFRNGTTWHQSTILLFLIHIYIYIYCLQSYLLISKWEEKFSQVSLVWLYIFKLPFSNVSLTSLSRDCSCAVIPSHLFLTSLFFYVFWGYNHSFILFHVTPSEIFVKDFPLDAISNQTSCVCVNVT